MRKDERFNFRTIPQTELHKPWTGRCLRPSPLQHIKVASSNSLATHPFVPWSSIQPVLAAVVHALSSYGQGGVCDRHHCRIRRWPLRAATVHTISFHVYGGVATEPNTICANGQKQQPLGTQTSPNRNGLSEATGGLLNSQTSQPMYVPFL